MAEETKTAAEKGRANKLRPMQKVALMLISVGIEAASEVLKHFNETEVERISIEIAKLQNVPAEDLVEVIEEYYEMIMANQYMAQGGISYARQMLEKAWGIRKADELIKRVEAATEVSAFYLLQTVDDKQLLNFLQNEHPQTAALILANLKPGQAASILSDLPEESQYEIAYRLATMEKTSPELIEDIEAVLRDQMGTVFGGGLSKTGGAESVANILNSISRTAEKNILNNLRERDAELATEITDFMFLFDDLATLGNDSIQRILKEADSNTLALSLKAASPQLQNKVFTNMSERAGAMLKEELEYLGPVRLKDVEAAQKAVLEIVHTLAENGEIVLSRGEEEELIE